MTDRFVIYAQGHRPPDLHSRTYVPVFTCPGAARSWLRRFIKDAEQVWEDDKTLLLSTDFEIRLRSDHWAEIMAAPGDPELVSPQDQQWILRFKYGTWDEVHSKEPATEDDGDEKRPRAPERERRPACPVEYVTISQLCAASGVLPTHARAALRASGRVKPAHGWAFAPNEVDAIKKLVGIK